MPALLDGLWMCKQVELRDLVIELDSKVIVSWLASGVCKYWFLWNFWEDVKVLVAELNVKFQHIFRVANMVANFLAKQGTQRHNDEFCGVNYVQWTIWGIIRLDKLGIPYIRRWWFGLLVGCLVWIKVYFRHLNFVGSFVFIDTT